MSFNVLKLLSYLLDFIRENNFHPLNAAVANVRLNENFVKHEIFTEFEMRVSFIGVFVLPLFYCVNNYAPVFIYISMCECMVETCI